MAKRDPKIAFSSMKAKSIINSHMDSINKNVDSIGSKLMRKITAELDLKPNEKKSLQAYLDGVRVEFQEIGSAARQMMDFIFIHSNSLGEAEVKMNNIVRIIGSIDDRLMCNDTRFYMYLLEKELREGGKFEKDLAELISQLNREGIYDVEA